MTTSSFAPNPSGNAGDTGATAAPVAVDIWLDIACPWCALGERRFEAALAQVPFADDVEVRFHSFQLDPNAPERSEQTHTTYLIGRGLSPERLTQSDATLTEAGRPLDFHFDLDHTIPSNTRTGHRMIQAAGTAGVQSEVVAALYSAYFEQGVDIGDPEALRGVVVDAGLPGELADRVLADESAFADGFEDDLQQAARLGISGVPFYVLDGRYGISGAQPEETLVAALTQVHDELNPAPLLMPAPGVVTDGGEVCGPDGCAI